MFIHKLRFSISWDCCAKSSPPSCPHFSKIQDSRKFDGSKEVDKKVKDYEEEEEEKDRNKESKDIEISAQTYSQCLFFSLNLIFCCY